MRFCPAAEEKNVDFQSGICYHISSFKTDVIGFLNRSSGDFPKEELQAFKGNAV